MSQTHCEHPREIDLEGELAIAEGARAKGDTKHALHHYLGALGLDPFSEQALAAIRRMNAESDLVPTLAEDGYAGAHIARAYLLADRNEHEEALAIMAQVDEAMPQLGAVALVSRWLDHVPPDSDARTWALRRVAGASQVGMGRVRLLP